MEAKDTVMSEKELEEVERAYLAEDFSVNAIRLNRGHTEDLRLRVAQAQAEISFRAGIKEVEEWLDRVIERAFLIALAALPMYDDDAEWANNSANVLRNAWQVKLKELGME